MRKNNLVILVSQRTTLHHWLMRSGKSRWLLVHLAKLSAIIVSEVGRTASRSLSSSLFAIHATSGAKPLACSASRLKKDSGMKSGKYAFWTPCCLIAVSSVACIFSQSAYP